MTATRRRILAGGLGRTAIAVATAMLAGYGSSDDNTPSQQQVTAQQACDALNGKIIGGATLIVTPARNHSPMAKAPRQQLFWAAVG